MSKSLSLGNGNLLLNSEDVGIQITTATQTASTSDWLYNKNHKLYWNGTLLTAYVTANNYVVSASFNLNNGEITILRSGTSTLPNVIVDIDGRYIDLFNNQTVCGEKTFADGINLLSNTHTLYYAESAGATPANYYVIYDSVAEIIYHSGNFQDTNNYVTGASFNTANGVLTMTRGGTSALSSVTVNLDGRYITTSTITNYVTDTNNYVISGTVTSSTLTLKRSGSSSLSSVVITGLTAINSDTNYYVTGVSFNTGNGNLTVTRNGLTSIITDLDGRYLTGIGTYDNYQYWVIADSYTNTTNISSTETFTIASGTGISAVLSGNILTINNKSTNTDTNYYVSGISFNTGNGILTLTRNGLSSLTQDLDGRYITAGATVTNWYLQSAIFSASGNILKMYFDVTGYGTITANISHNHDLYYYTEDEIDNLFSGYYTKTNLQTSGEASVHWKNLTNLPATLTSQNTDLHVVSGNLTGTTLELNLSGTSTATVSISLSSFDTRYETSGSSYDDWNITDSAGNTKIICSKDTLNLRTNYWIDAEVSTNLTITHNYAYSTGSTFNGAATSTITQIKYDGMGHIYSITDVDIAFRYIDSLTYSADSNNLSTLIISQVNESNYSAGIGYFYIPSNQITIGYNASASGNNDIVIGYSAKSSHTNAVVLGYQITSHITSAVHVANLYNFGFNEFKQITSPTVTTNKLYNVGGALYWNGIILTGFSTTDKYLSALNWYDNSFDLSAVVTNGTNITVSLAHKHFELYSAQSSTGSSKVKVSSTKTIIANDLQAESDSYFYGENYFCSLSTFNGEVEINNNVQLSGYLTINNLTGIYTANRLYAYNNNLYWKNYSINKPFQIYDSGLNTAYIEVSSIYSYFHNSINISGQVTIGKETTGLIELFPYDSTPPYSSPSPSTNKLWNNNGFLYWQSVSLTSLTSNPYLTALNWDSATLSLSAQRSGATNITTAIPHIHTGLYTAYDSISSKAYVDNKGLVINGSLTVSAQANLKTYVQVGQSYAGTTSDSQIRLYTDTTSHYRNIFLDTDDDYKWKVYTTDNNVNIGTPREILHSGWLDDLYGPGCATIIVATENSNKKDFADFICTGSGNHASKIQSAIDSLSSSGGTIVFLEGTYNISSQLNFTANCSSIRLVGLGKSTIFNIDSTDGLYFGHSSNDVSLYNIEIENIYFYAEEDLSPGTKDAITFNHIENCKEIRIQNCHFYTYNFDHTIYFHTVDNVSSDSFESETKLLFSNNNIYHRNYDFMNFYTLTYLDVNISNNTFKSISNYTVSSSRFTYLLNFISSNLQFINIHHNSFVVTHTSRNSYLGRCIHVNYTSPQMNINNNEFEIIVADSGTFNSNDEYVFMYIDDVGLNKSYLYVDNNIFNSDSEYTNITTYIDGSTSSINDGSISISHNFFYRNLECYFFLPQGIINNNYFEDSTVYINRYNRTKVSNNEFIVTNSSYFTSSTNLLVLEQYSTGVCTINDNIFHNTTGLSTPLYIKGNISTSFQSYVVIVDNAFSQSSYYTLSNNATIETQYPFAGTNNFFY